MPTFRINFPDGTTTEVTDDRLLTYAVATRTDGVWAAWSVHTCRDRAARSALLAPCGPAGKVRIIPLDPGGRP